MGISLGKIVSDISGGANPWAMAGGKLLDAGTSLIAQKYGADLQGHEIDKQNQYNRDMAAEQFNRQIAENTRVFNENVKRDDFVFARQKEYNAEMWEKEKAYNLDMWNKQNEYNTPAAQMQRMREAGLNPALMYTQGNVGNATAVSIAKPDSATLQSEKKETARAEYTPSGVVDRGRMLMEGLQNYYRLRATNLQYKNLAVDAELTRAQADETRERARSLKHENDLVEGTKFSKNDPQWWKGVRNVIGRAKGYGDYVKGNAKDMAGEGKQVLGWLRSQGQEIKNLLVELKLKKYRPSRDNVPVPFVFGGGYD